jgi:hypothetical protein
MSSLWLDVQYAIRLMIKAPGLAAVLVITLALGVGASTTIFSVVNSVLLRPLPYDKPDELVRVYTEFTRPRIGQYSRVPEVPTGKSHSYIVVRTERDPASYTAAVTRALAEIDPALPMARLHTMDDLMWQAIARPRFLTFLLGCFATAALRIE